MRKIIVSAFLCLCIAIYLLPTTTFADVGEEFTVQSTDATPVNVTVKVITEPDSNSGEPGTVQVGNGSNLAVASDVTSVTLPEVVKHPGSNEEYKVTDVGNYAFNLCKELESVSLPEVTTIGDNAFYYCENLATVSLPEATTIGDNAFYNCRALATVDFPEVTTIGDNAFYYCENLATVSLPEATTIGDYAFCYCKNLATVSLPKATTIGDNAFYYCENLATVSLPEATTIGDNAFYNCRALATVDLPEATTIGKYAFRKCGKLATVSLPKATTIGLWAFYDCSALATVDLPEVNVIGEGAFLGCTKLESVTIWRKTSAPTLENANVFSDVPSTCKLYVPRDAKGYTRDNGWPVSDNGDNVVYLWSVSGTVYDTVGSPANDATVSVYGISTKPDDKNIYTVYVKPSDSTDITARIEGAGEKSISVSNVQGALTGKDIIFGQVAMPSLNPAGGRYVGEQSVTISCSTEGSMIRYTTDGTEPDKDSTVYSGGISVKTVTTIKAKAFKKGLADSEVAEAVYTITTPNKTGKSNSPLTGDGSNMNLWTALLLISLGAVTVLEVANKRKKAK